MLIIILLSFIEVTNYNR